MKRIEQAFARCREEGRAALIPYIMAGDPDLGTTARLIPALAQAGADLLEVGIPFSDPIADGPTIQEAAERSLRQGTTLRRVLHLIRQVRRQTNLPLILMTYANPVHRFGIGRFCEAAARAGVDGWIIPDLPPEEAGEWLPEARSRGLATIFLLAPTSTPERIQRVVSVSTGFVYSVSLTGITGSRLSDLRSVQEKIQEIRRQTTVPVAVGFGIQTPEQAAQVGQWADGVIVGSALVREVARSRRDPVPRARRFVATLRSYLARGGRRWPG